MIAPQINTASPAQSQSFVRIRRLVARVLLKYAASRRQLTHRDIAALVGTDWETVHASLISLEKEGALRFERHRLIINGELLQKCSE